MDSGDNGFVSSETGGSQSSAQQTSSQRPPSSRRSSAGPTGGDATPAKDGTADADWDPFFESDDP